MRSPITRLLLAALAVLVLFISAATGTEAQAPPAPTTQQTAAPAPLRNNCARLYTRHRHDKTARGYFRQDHLTRRQAHWLWKLRHCQQTDQAERRALRYEHRLKAQRERRQAMYCGSPACNRRLMFHMADRRFGHGAGACLDPIISQESGYHVDVNYGGQRGGWNGRGAYGIPQANPGSKMASAGADWEFGARTQIRWLLAYVAGRYGGPCGALAYKRAHGTY